MGRACRPTAVHSRNLSPRQPPHTTRGGTLRSRQLCLAKSISHTLSHGHPRTATLLLPLLLLLLSCCCCSSSCWQCDFAPAAPLLLLLQHFCGCSRDSAVVAPATAAQLLLPLLPSFCCCTSCYYRLCRCLYFNFCCCCCDLCSPDHYCLNRNSRTCFLYRFPTHSFCLFRTSFFLSFPTSLFLFAQVFLPVQVSLRK